MYDINSFEKSVSFLVLICSARFSSILIKLEDNSKPYLEDKSSLKFLMKDNFSNNSLTQSFRICLIRSLDKLYFIAISSRVFPL